MKKLGVKVKHQDNRTDTSELLETDNLCGICEKAILTTEYEKNKNQLFCSRECQQTAQRINYRHSPLKGFPKKQP